MNTSKNTPIAVINKQIKHEDHNIANNPKIFTPIQKNDN